MFQSEFYTKTFSFTKAQLFKFTKSKKSNWEGNKIFQHLKTRKIFAKKWTRQVHNN